MPHKVKVCFVGSSGSGKSNIISRLNKLPYYDKGESTIGGAHSICFEPNSGSVRLDLWEAGGAWPKHTKAYLEDSQIVVFVLDITAKEFSKNEIAQLINNKKLADQYASKGYAPIFVLNKSDKHTPGISYDEVRAIDKNIDEKIQMVRQALIDTNHLFNGHERFVVCSAKDSLNIDKLSDHLFSDAKEYLKNNEEKVSDKPKSIFDSKQIFEVANKLPQDKSRRNAEVFAETVKFLEDKNHYDHVRQCAEVNMNRWKSLAQDHLQAAKCTVRVLPDDWASAARLLTEETGEMVAVLNMANAEYPGGHYKASAQEENMFRRTDCSLSITTDLVEQTEHDGVKYKKEMTQLINGDNGKVFLDTEHPRVCFKAGDAEDYKMLHHDQMFLFIEMRAAAQNCSQVGFNEGVARAKIKAQFATLIEKGVKNVVLSAFGCGMFANPPETIAKIYHEEINLVKEHFHSIDFAILRVGNGPDKNYDTFAKEFANFGQENKVTTQADNTSNDQVSAGDKQNTKMSQQPKKGFWDRHNILFGILSVVTLGLFYIAYKCCCSPAEVSPAPTQPKSTTAKLHGDGVKVSGEMHAQKSGNVVEVVKGGKGKVVNFAAKQTSVPENEGERQTKGLTVK